MNPVGFSNGCAELALYGPPPFVPSSLIASCDAIGPPGIVWVAPETVVASVNPCRFWTTPWLTRISATTIGQRKKHPGHAPRQVDPEVADRRRAPPHEPAHERDRNREANRGGDEVLHRQPGHLGEVAHGQLAAVVLPVRVGDEADRGVERERRRNADRVGRIERQRALQALEPVEAEHRDEAEREHRERVHGPGLLT